MSQAVQTGTAAAAPKDKAPDTWRRRSLVRVRRPAWAQAAAPQRPASR